MVSSAGMSGGETGPCWLQTSQAVHRISLDASPYWATTIPSNCTTRCNSVAIALKRSLRSRCAPMACDTRINASYRSDSRCSDGASESEVMRMLGAATIIPLSLLMSHYLAAMQKPDIFFQVALREPAASMFYPTDLKRHNGRN